MKLPDIIAKRKAIINIQNKDNKCFMWSILRYFHLNDVLNPERLTRLKQYEKDLNFKGISFPVELTDISKFEKQNPNIPPINVFSLNEKNEIYPLRYGDQNCEKTIDLFFYKKGDSGHYSFIKNFNKLVDLQLSKDTRKKHFCKRFIQHYTKPELLQKHIEYCSTNGELALVKMPKPPYNKIKFKNFVNQLFIPFVIYADFESFTLTNDMCDPNTNESYYVNYQDHTPCGFCLYVKPLDKVKEEVIPNNLFIYTKENENENIAEMFVKKKIIKYFILKKNLKNQ